MSRCGKIGMGCIRDAWNTDDTDKADKTDLISIYLYHFGDLLGSDSFTDN